MKTTIIVQCIRCRTKRTITLAKAAKGQPFCSECGNMEVPVRARNPRESKAVSRIEQR